MASTLLRAARNASLAPRAAAAAATRAAGMASRSPRASGVAAAAARAARLYSGFPLKSCPTRDDGSTKPRDDDALCRTSSCADDAHLSDDDGIIPMDKDLESDEAVWALYERWCKAFNKQRNHAEMARRFKIFKHHAQHVHNSNSYVPEDPEEAAIYCRKRRQVELLLSKGKDVSHIDDQYLPMVLYDNADGRDPFPSSEYDKNLLKEIEEREAHGAVKDATVESFA